MDDVLERPGNSLGPQAEAGQPIRELEGEDPGVL